MKVSFQAQKSKNFTREKGVQIPYAPGKRKVSQWRWYLILFVVSSPLIYFFSRIILSLTIVTASGYLSLEKVAINSASPGYVARINVETGDQVNKGDVLIELGNPELDEREYILKSELAYQRAQNSPFGTKILEYLKNKVKLARKDVNYQKNKLTNVRFLFNQGAATIAELNLSEAAYRGAQITLNEAQANLTAELERRKAAPGTPTELARRHNMILAELKVIREQRARLYQRADYDGRILDVLVAKGENIGSATPLLLLGRIDKPSVVAYLNPKYAKYAISGRSATVKLPGGETVKAMVREDANLSKRLPASLSSPINSRDLMILVKLDILDPLTPEKSIDNMPVSMRFDFFW